MTACSHRFCPREQSRYASGRVNYRRHPDDHLPVQQHVAERSKEFGLVSSVSVIFTLVPYLYTCAALLLLGHGHFGKARPMYLLVTFIAFVYCIWAVVGSGAKEVMWSFVTLMIITALYALNYNRIHKTRIHWMHQ